MRRSSSQAAASAFTLLVLASCALGQAPAPSPHLGYIYPAGGQQGAKFLVVAGGQYLWGVSSIRVTGEGVTARVIVHAPPPRPLDWKQRRLLAGQLVELATARAQEEGLLSLGPVQEFSDQFPVATRIKADEEVEPIPEHPLLKDLESKSLEELGLVARVFLTPVNPLQRAPSIAELLLMEVTIAPDAVPGERELRLGRPAAVTNPLRFEVGLVPEIREMEPNDKAAAATTPPELPFVANGQILPGDVDRFRFVARQGDRLVVRAEARSLVPYLADAVPGWFQAVLTLYDSLGREVAFNDDYRFDPDPVILCEIPADGEYVVEVRDSIYRGREDFVYRLSIGEEPFVTGMFPLGGPEGVATVASLSGWNLPNDRLPLDTVEGPGSIRSTTIHSGSKESNELTYGVGALPECDEEEPNDSAEDALRVETPIIVNGSIDKPGEVDIFRCGGRAGEELVVDVLGRRLGSPIDSLVQVTDLSGKVIAWNDDTPDKEAGLVTHQADSYLRVALPEDNVYLVRIADAQGKGGPEYAYRLRIGPPQRDFALRATPSSLTFVAGQANALTIYALRRDGFDGPIEIAPTDFSTGFRVNGGTIPPGRDSLRITLMAPPQVARGPVALSLEGRAEIDGEVVLRPVVPAEDMMQAFLYRHLVPCQELLASVMGVGGNVPPFEIAGVGTMRVPRGGQATMRVLQPNAQVVRAVGLTLSDPPEGLRLAGVSKDDDGFTVTIEASADGPEIGYRDNLIIQISGEQDAPARDGATRKQRVAIGTLPAIPYEIVAP